MFEARAQFAADVAEAFQVLLGMADALLGLAAPLLVAGDPGGLFHEQLEIGGAGLHQPADGALFDDGVTAGPRPVPRKRSVTSLRRHFWPLIW